MRHAKWLEDVAVHIFGERLAGYALDDVAGEGHPGVRGGRDVAARIKARRQGPREPGAEWLRHRMSGEHALHMFLEAGAMRQQTPQGDRDATRGRRNVEIEIGVDVAVEIELALLDQLHHCD